MTNIKTSIKKYILTNNCGDEIHISNFGARLLKWNTLVAGERRNIILGYQQLEDYLTDPFFIGAIVGPYANRIGNSNVNIGEENYPLKSNEGAHHLHGGPKGISDLYWQCQRYNNQSLTLICSLEQGYNGYPGPMAISVTYQLNNNSELSIAMQVNSDKVTVAGPTSHPYFNLSIDNDNVAQHQLQLFSSLYTPLDSDSIPTGELCKVSNTHLDYQHGKRLELNSPLDALDHNFIISNVKNGDKLDDAVSLHAILTSPDEKLQLIVESNYPALQVYTGGHLGKPFKTFSGMCLEPQFSPNSPNEASFPFSYTIPGSSLKKLIIYRLNKL